MAHDVFVSYPSENKSIADAICAKLESNNIRCWIAPRDILPGQNYAEALLNAIDSSKIFILVFSENTNKSPHIMSEVQRAFNHNRIIIPFRIENIEPSTALEYYIGNAHWLDAITPPIEAQINKLVNVVKINLEPQKDGQSTDISQQKKTVSDPIKKSAIIKYLSLTIILILLAVCIGFFYGTNLINNGPTPPTTVPPTTVPPTTVPPTTVPPTTVPPTPVPSTTVPPTPVPSTIKITSSPSGANVYIDSSYRGTTPLILSSIPLDTYSIKLSLSGYDDYITITTVSSGQTTYIDATLNSLPVQFMACIDGSEWIKVENSKLTIKHDDWKPIGSAGYCPSAGLEGIIVINNKKLPITYDNSSKTYKINGKDYYSMPFVSLSGFIKNAGRGDVLLSGNEIYINDNKQSYADVYIIDLLGSTP